MSRLKNQLCPGAEGIQELKKEKVVVYFAEAGNTEFPKAQTANLYLPARSDKESRYSFPLPRKEIVSLLSTFPH